MIRLLGGGIFALILLVLWVYCIFDVIASEPVLVRNLPKMVWLLIVIFLPDIGSIAWLALGRPSYAGWRPGDTTARPPRRVRGPEDSPSFPTFGAAEAAPNEEEGERLRAWEADLRRREEDLRRGDDGEPKAGPADS